ncbi:enoyl-CoA hydratase [Pigmentiphaga soli]|uniref:Enoyl-CoA hydratase n=1 Tax=Pigmentiphaga soli TaxID=1007095 RepID=A0ABP8GUE0_9BURK
MNQPIHSARRGHALVLSLARPDRRNRFDTETLRQLAGEIEAAAADASIRAVVLSGSGETFCCGGDVGATPAQRQAFGPAFIDAVTALGHCAVPVLAAVNGACSAGGMTLLEAADFAIAADDASFGYPEILAGAFPLLALVTAPAHMPKKLFFDLAYGGHSLTAHEAMAAGLVNRVVGADALWDEIDRYVDALAQRRAAAIARGRRLYYAAVAPVRREALAAAAAALVEAAPIKAAG